MKIIILSIFLALVNWASGQDRAINSRDPETDFKLSLTIYNRDEYFPDGTTIFILTNSSITVVKQIPMDTVQRAVYHKDLSKEQGLISSISHLRLDTLKSLYFNYCIPTASGIETIVEYANGDVYRKIAAHHYYLRQIDDLIRLLNPCVPKKYRTKYLEADVKQACGGG